MKNQFVKALLAYAVQRNLNWGKLIEASGINEVDLESGNIDTITSQQMELLWRHAAEWSGDDLFGLHFAESMQLAALGVVGQLLATSRTTGEALTQACSLVPLITDMFTIEVAEKGDIAFIQLLYSEVSAQLNPFTFRHLADYLTAFTLLEMKGLILDKIKLRSVSFPYRVNSKEYDRVFQCRVVSGSKHMVMEIDRSDLQKKVITADHEMHLILLGKLQSMMNVTGEVSTFSRRVHHFILTNSYLDLVSIENVAANFNMSSRNLQRKLKEEGTSFSDLVANVHKDLAISYLKTGKYPAKEVAFLLGYREPSSFARAFKKWTGTTPAAYVEGSFDQ